jgi:hypothetical protein
MLNDSIVLGLFARNGSKIDNEFLREIFVYSGCDINNISPAMREMIGNAMKFQCFQDFFCQNSEASLKSTGMEQPEPRLLLPREAMEDDDESLNPPLCSLAKWFTEDGTISFTPKAGWANRNSRGLSRKIPP